MARSNTGGTRGFLRGKVANDLFQVTKNARGRKVQIVKAYEYGRINPNTEAQALARMQMALCMGSLSQFKALVDHSWETIPYGQLSIAHFVHVNMPLIQQDSRDNWYSGSEFDYPTKGLSEVRLGPFIMSEGSLALPQSLTSVVELGLHDTCFLDINIGKTPFTFGDIREALGASVGDYITHIALYSAYAGLGSNGIGYVRAYLAQDISDETVVNAANVSQMFTYDGNAGWNVTLYNNTHIRIEVIDPIPQWTRQIAATDIIISKWNGQNWCRNNSQFTPPSTGYEPWSENAAPDDVFQSWYEDYNGEQPT